MEKNDLFGWDLLYKITEPQIRNNQDVIICLTHWKLIHQGFRCVGVGEDATPPNPYELSEVLADGWNYVANRYTLRYVHKNMLYLLNAIKTDSNMIINLNRVSDNRATGICVNINEVKEVHGSISTIIPNYKEIINSISQELIDPMLSNTLSRNVETQTITCQPRESDSINISITPNEPVSSSFQRHLTEPYPVPYNGPLREVGRSDVDPFASGGGMILPEPGIGPRIPRPIDPTVPPGAVPPGARYDPFGPIQPPRPQRPPRSQNPDHDHLPPPGYDDMFL